MASSDDCDNRSNDRLRFSALPCVAQLGLVLACLLSMPLTHVDAQFTTVLNIPDPDANIGFWMLIDSNTQVNLSDGGSIGFSFDVGNSDGTSTNVELNITGGSVDSALRAYSGSVVNLTEGSISSGFEATDSIVNISGGRLGKNFGALLNSLVTISGGIVRNYFEAEEGSSVTLVGSDFHLGNTPISGLGSIDDSVALDLSDDFVLSGIYADGTPFVFDSDHSSSFATGSLTLQAAEAPVYVPGVVSIDSPSDLGFVYDGQTVVVVPGGVLGNDFFVARGGALEIQGGEVLNSLQATSAAVAISAGRMGYGFAAVNGTAVEISGGTVGTSFGIFSGSQAKLIGGEFYLNGTSLTGLENVGDSLAVNLGSDFVLSGTFADGTPFAFSSDEKDFFEAGSLTLQAATLPEIGPAVTIVTADTEIVSSNIRQGQTVIVTGGGSIDSRFNVGRGSHLIVSGGVVEASVKVIAATVTLTDGFIHQIEATDRSTLNISEGYVSIASVSNESTLNISEGFLTRLYAVSSQVNLSGTGHLGRVNLGGGSTLNSSGGKIDSIDIGEGSTINFSGGEVTYDLNMRNGTLNLSGGVIPDFGSIYSGSVINVSGGMLGKESEGFFPTSSGFVGNGAILNVSGGEVGSDILVRHGGVVNLSGGRIGRNLEFYGGTLNLSGGTIAPGLEASSSSSLNISGGEFFLNGVPVEGVENVGDSLQIMIFSSDDVFSGTLADGTPFAFSNRLGDSVDYSNWSLQSVALPELSPVVHVSDSTELMGARPDQAVYVTSTGTLKEGFNLAYGSTLNVEGGIVGDYLEVLGATVNLRAGTLGKGVALLDNSTLNMFGGSIDDIEGNHRVENELSIRLDSSTINISGADVFPSIQAFNDSTVNIEVVALENYGNAVSGLTLGNLLTYGRYFDDMTGRLADGTYFEFRGYSGFGKAIELDSSSSLTITLVEANFLAGDYNDDGVVDAADYTVWRDSVGQDPGTLPNDPNLGYVGELQYDTWVANYGRVLAPANSLTVPEPTTGALLLLCTVMLGVKRDRS